jgi:hypothetical protein
VIKAFLILSHEKETRCAYGCWYQRRKRAENFRDSDGLWNGYNIKDVAHTARLEKKIKQLVLEFYNMRRRDVLNAVPNAAHTGVAELEKGF